jgi:hypothetical protein
MVIEGSEPPKDQTPAAVASADHAVVAQSSEPATSTASSQEEEGQDARLSSQPVPRSVLDVLRSEDYLQLSAAERLEVLRFLIDEVLQTDSFWYMLLVPIIIYYLLFIAYVLTAIVITIPLFAGTTRTTRKRSCWLSRQSSGRRNETRKGRSESLRTRTRPVRRARRARTFSLPLSP